MREGVPPDGAEQGLNPSYPIRFSGKVVKCSGDNEHIARFSGVSDDALVILSGVYFGWASIVQKKRSPSYPTLSDADDVWYPAIVKVSLEREKVKVVQQKNVTVQIVDDAWKAPDAHVKLDIMLMARLRSDNTATELQQDQTLEDSRIAKASLERPAWQPEAMLERIKSESSARSFSKRVADVRQDGLQHVNKLSAIGVRTASMGASEHLIGTGGICVKRQSVNLMNEF